MPQSGAAVRGCEVQCSKSVPYSVYKFERKHQVNKNREMSSGCQRLNTLADNNFVSHFENNKVFIMFR